MPAKQPKDILGVYHIAPLANLPSILRRGALSHAQAERQSPRPEFVRRSPAGKNDIMPPDMSQELKVNAVTKDEFMALQVRSPRRMRLASSRFLTRNEEGNPWHGKCTAPFTETVGPLFKGRTGITLEHTKHGLVPFCSVRSKSEFDRIESWVRAQGSRVFLRTLMPCCVALDLPRQKPRGPRTMVGELEYRAKRGDEQAETRLGEMLTRAIQDMPIYSDARFIAAVPPLREKSRGLASRLARDAALSLGIVDLTENFFRHGEAPAIKGMAEEDKWDGAEKAELVLSAHPKKLPKEAESVILLDDKYQSGTTMHYVAMRMQAAGIKGPILGLVAVKTLRDDDNKR